MKKKHFAGVLMLTAAVALGTVSPVALPNTAVVVKAETNYSIDTTTADTNFTDAVVEATGSNTVKLTIKKDYVSKVNGKYKYAFGDTEQAAVNAAMADGAVALTVDAEGVATIPSTDAKLHLAILDPSTKKTDNKVNGLHKLLTAGGAAPTIADVPDGTQAQGAAEQEYAEVVEGKKADELTWTATTGDNKFPADGVVKPGDVKKYLVRVKASGTTYAGATKEVTITKKKPFEFSELSQLTYTFVKDNGVKVQFSGLDKGEFVKDNRGGKKFAYKIVNNTDDLTKEATYSGGTVINNNDKTSAAITKDQKLVVFAEADEKKAENHYVLEVKQAAKPVLKQVDKEYQIEAGENYTIAGNYKIQKGGTGDFKTAILKNVAGKNVIVVDGPDNTDATVSYVVQAVGSEYTTFKFNDNKAEFVLDSDNSENVAVAKVDTKVSKAIFEGIKFTISTDTKNVELSNFKAGLANKVDKVKYTYGNKTGYLTADAKEDKVTLPVTTGKLTLEVEGNANFVRTVEFVSAGKDDKQIERSYTSPDDIWVALGGNLTDANDTPLAAYKIREKGKTEGAEVKKPVYNKTAVYYIKRAAAGNIATGDITFTDPYKAITIQEEFEVYLQTEADKKKQDKTLVKDAVVPVTGSTSGAKKEEPKKEEPKKEEPKKDDTKKEEPKKDDAKNTDNSSTTTDTKQPAQVDAKNTKSNSVSVSAEKIADALEGGLKVTGKSGEVKFAASAVKKVVGTEPVEVKVTLKTSVKKTTDKIVTKKLHGSKVLGGKVFALDLSVGNTAVKESKMKSTSVTVTLKANLGKAKKTVYVLDLSSGKRVKATYKNGKVTFKTKYLGRFVIVNKAK